MTELETLVATGAAASRLRKQADRIEALEAALRGLYEFCAKQNEIRLDSRVMRNARAALDKDKA